jgi:hypothetical protein
MRWVILLEIDRLHRKKVSKKFAGSVRDFPFQKNLLKNLMSCHECNAAMSLVPSSSSKSLVSQRTDLVMLPCKKNRNNKAESALFGQKIALKTFIQLLFCLSIKELIGIAIYPR